MKNTFLTILAFLIVTPLFSQMKPDEKRMQWFEDAKLGIFIHWGIYAVN
ncbi:MAG: alpha-L-fucosidase, partial [Bacteroidetes bacterium]